MNTSESRIWLTNIGKHQSSYTFEQFSEMCEWRDLELGLPKANTLYSLEKLIDLGYQGIYRTSNSKKGEQK